MSFSISFELVLAFIIQFVVVVAFFASLKEKVKFLEVDVKELQDAIKESHEKHELIARIDAKLDLLIKQISTK